MACCGRGKKTPRTPAAPPVPATPKARPLTPKHNKKMIPTAPPGSYNPPGKFCDKCGWVVAVSKYSDPTTGQVVEKRSCTNRKCSDY